MVKLGLRCDEGLFDRVLSHECWLMLQFPFCVSF